MPALAADPEAGREMAAQCAGCHGEAGVTVDAEIPNLAAQKADYLEAQLEAFREGERSNPLMNAIAAQLDDAQIENLAAHFAAPAGRRAGRERDDERRARGNPAALPGGLRRELHALPHDRLPRPQAGPLLLGQRRGARGGAGGRAVPAGRVSVRRGPQGRARCRRRAGRGRRTATSSRAISSAYTAMEKSAGWGDEVPEILRNDDWRYAVFTPEGEHRAGVNEAQCLACHKPLTETDYTFTFADAKEAAAQQ